MSGPYDLSKKIQREFRGKIALENAIQPGRSIELIAHRGFMADNMQNTLHALSSAMLQGADSVELDVCVSSDGVIYLFHDLTVDSLTSGSGTFTELSSAYLDTLTFDRLSGTKFSDMRLTKLDSAIDWLKKTGAFCYPEIKSIRQTSDIDLIVNKFIDAGLMGKTCFQSFSIEQVRYIHERYPTALTGFLTNTTDAALLRSMVDELSRYNGQSLLLLSFDRILADTDIVRYCRSMGVEIGAWTVRNQNEIDSVMAAGVYKIMSDYNARDGRS